MGEFIYLVKNNSAICS